MNKFINYVESLGFDGVIKGNTALDPQQIRAFRFDSFNPRQIRHTMGKSRRHKRDLFVFVLRAGRAVRVDTKRKIVLLGNGKKAVKALLATIPGKD